jgi:hypothetical protein
MKRKLKWIAAVLIVLLLGFVAAVYFWPRDRITAASWEKIQIGMTEKEVEEILGKPGVSGVAFVKHVEVSPISFTGPVLVEEPESPSDSEKYWIGQRGIMRIGFDKACEVAVKRFQEVRSTEPTFIDRIRDWLGW